MNKRIREVRVVDIFTCSVIPPILLTLIWVLRTEILRLVPLDAFIVYLPMVVISYILLKRSLMGLVLLYKIFAPTWLRDQCRFEPTCSTYMILAIQKYGIIIGVTKGLRRIVRCRPPNGGEDYP